MPDVISTAAAPDGESAAFIRDRQRLKETDFVLQFVEKSREHREPFLAVWNEVLDNYLVTPAGGRQAQPRIGSRQFVTASALRSDNIGQSVLKDPETNQIIDTLAAQGIGLLMPSSDYIQAMPIGFDDTQKARFLGRLLQGILQAPGTYRTNFTTFKDGFIFGTAILEIGWETRSRIQVVNEPVFDNETGLLVGQKPGVGEVVYRDAPLIRQKDIFDFYPDPSGTRIQEDMLGIAHKFRVSTQEALRLGHAGVYSLNQVREAVRRGSDDVQKSREEKRFEDIDRETHEDYGMLTGFEFWGETPFAPPDGARNRVITILNGVHIRSHINPYLDGNIPFKEVILNPIAGRFYGLGVGEVIRFLQDSTDHLLMLYTDAADLAVRNVLMVGNGFNGDIRRLARRVPNDVIPVGNPAAVVPLEINLNALQFSAGELQRRKQNMREASGATNPLQAIPSGSDRQTATEINELVRLASQKVELMVQLVEKDTYPWVGKTIHSRIRQFLSEEREEILAGERFPVTLDDVDFDADIRFVGARQAQSKSQKAAALREAINILGNIEPDRLPALAEVISRYFRDGLDIQDGESIVNNMIQISQQQVQAAREAEVQLQGGNEQAQTSDGLNTASEEVQRQGVALG